MEKPILQKENNRLAKPTRARFIILLLLFCITAINYIDRAAISVVGPIIQKDLNLSPALLGLIFSAFSWTYTGMQIPSGTLLDRFGSKVVYGISLIGWSLFTGLQAFSTGFASLFGLRLGLGISESPAFPANNRITVTWFPQNERGMSTSVYTAGEYVGLAFATPALFWIMEHFGWRAVFICAGGLGLLFSLIWYKIYNDPSKYKKINEAELSYIREGGGLADAVEKKGKLNISTIAPLIKGKKMLGLYIGQFAITSTLFFFLTWFPTYLAEAKGLTFINGGGFTAIPYIAAFLGVLFGGNISDWLIKRGVSVSFARKLPVITGLILTCSIVLANFTNSIPLVITILSVAFFAQGMSNTAWAILAEIAPGNSIGLAGGFFNFISNLAGIFTPMIIGFIIDATNSYSIAIGFVGSVAFVGALSIIILVGNIQRIDYVKSKQ